MTSIGFEVFVVTILLGIIPDPIVWALLFLVGLLFIIAYWRLPASVATQSMFLIIFTVNQYLGGIFNIMNMIMMGAIGVLLVAGILKLGGR